ELLLGGATDGWNLAIATMAQERVAISGYVNFDRASILRTLAERRQDTAAIGTVLLGEADAYANAIKVLAVREVLRILDGQAAGPASSIAKVAMNVM
ncbi:acyl-CoA dehydrogenase, partial [Mycobacterium sp. ITM-2017-0098]